MPGNGQRHDRAAEQGGFVSAERWASADEWERFRLRSIAFGLALAPDCYLTEAAAQVIHGLPTLHDPPSAPIAMRPGSAHRGPDRSPFGRVRTGYLPPRYQANRGRVRVVGLPYAAVDIARHTDHAEALTVMDRTLRPASDPAELAHIVEHMENYPGIGIAGWAVVHGDARSESALESLGRLAFLEAGEPPPLSNVWIDGGSRAVRVDHLIPDTGVVIEADGALKVNNRPDAATVIENQVERERFPSSPGLLGRAVQLSDRSPRVATKSSGEHSGLRSSVGTVRHRQAGRSSPRPACSAGRLQVLPRIPPVA